MTAPFPKAGTRWATSATTAAGGGARRRTRPRTRRPGRALVGVASAALLLSTALLVAAVPTGAQAGSIIQPGDFITIGNAGCTLNFVFDGPHDEVYVGSAAHCGETGQSVSTSGSNNFGTVVYDDDGGIDFMLIRVKKAFRDQVRPQVKGHPEWPTGVASHGETAIGDLLGMSGNGIGFGFTSVTREERVGPLVTDGRSEYCAGTPATFGDSGGPIVHIPTGKALGVVSRISPFECAGSLTGPMVGFGLTRAMVAGFPAKLRTV